MLSTIISAKINTTVLHKLLPVIIQNLIGLKSKPKILRSSFAETMYKKATVPMKQDVNLLMGFSSYVQRIQTVPSFIALANVRFSSKNMNVNLENVVILCMIAVKLNN
jgi:hypothetical protein